MDVREIPNIVFNQLVQEPEHINMRQFAKAHPKSLSGQLNYCDYPNRERTIGEAQDFWLAIQDDGGTAQLSVFDYRSEAILDYLHDGAYGRLIAGKHTTGTWGYELGQEFEENIWVAVNRLTFYGPDQIKTGMRGLALMGHIALLGKELVESGAFETSVLFESETHPASFK